MIIPTCNRHKAVDALLFQSAYQLQRYGIDIIIYDSSDNNKTEATVYNFQVDGCDNVIYKRYDGVFDEFSLDHKVMQAYQDYVDEYEYLWVCGDGLIITIDRCVEKLCKFAEQLCDFIIVDAHWRNDFEKKECLYEDIEDSVALFEENAARMIVLGAIIMSSKFVRCVLEIPLDEKTYGLWVMAAALHCCANQNTKAVLLVDQIYNYNNMATSNSFWNQEGHGLRQWSCLWHTVVTNLPPIYEPLKPYVLKIEMWDFHPFHIMSLLRMRGNGGLSIALIKKYKMYLIDVSDTAISKFYLTALTPKWLARFLVKHEQGRLVVNLKKIYRCFKPMNVEDIEK